MHQVEIRPIQPAEVEDAFELVRAVAQAELGMPAEALGSYRDLMERAVSDPSGASLFLGSRQNGNISGVLLGARPEGGVLTIIWLIVSPQHRGLGHGAALFRQSCTWARVQGCHKIKLTASAPDAVRFYEHLGMKVEGFHRKHWWQMDFWSLGIQVPTE